MVLRNGRAAPETVTTAAPLPRTRPCDACKVTTFKQVSEVALLSVLDGQPLVISFFSTHKPQVVCPIGGIVVTLISGTRGTAVFTVTPIAIVALAAMTPSIA